MSICQPALARAAQTNLPENLGAGLRELVAAHRAGQLTGLDLRKSRLAMNSRDRSPRAGVRRTRTHYRGRAHIMIDSRNRVMVKILLAGAVPMSRLSNNLQTLGADVTASDPNWRAGVFEIPPAATGRDRCAHAGRDGDSPAALTMHSCRIGYYGGRSPAAFRSGQCSRHDHRERS